jgi:hypothetical protein
MIAARRQRGLPPSLSLSPSLWCCESQEWRESTNPANFYFSWLNGETQTQPDALGTKERRRKWEAIYTTAGIPAVNRILGGRQHTCTAPEMHFQPSVVDPYYLAYLKVAKFVK